MATDAKTTGAKTTSAAFDRAAFLDGIADPARREEADRLLTIFAEASGSRKAELSVYILPGYADFGDILARLGPHRTGKACLYLKRLDRVDEGALRELIRAGLEDLGKRWTIHPI